MPPDPNLKPVLRLFSFLALAVTASGQVFLTDDFSAGTLNTSNWTQTTPFGDSAVAVAGGNLVLTNRGRVLTQGAFSGGSDIALTFQFSGSAFDSFKLATRTNGSTTNGSAEFDSGIFASFRIQSDGGTTANNVTLYSQDYPNATGTSLAQGTFAMTTGQSYSVRFLDTGSAVSLYINDLVTPFLSAVNSEGYGNQMGLYNREGAAAGSAISAGSQVLIGSFTVTAIPEPSTYAATLGILALWLANRRRPDRARHVS
jgi:hypothetical protein